VKQVKQQTRIEVFLNDFIEDIIGFSPRFESYFLSWVRNHPTLNKLCKNVDTYGEKQVLITDKYRFLEALRLLVQTRTIKSEVLRELLL